VHEVAGHLPCPSCPASRRSHSPKPLRSESYGILRGKRLAWQPSVAGVVFEGCGYATLRPYSRLPTPCRLASLRRCGDFDGAPACVCLLRVTRLTWPIPHLAGDVLERTLLSFASLRCSFPRCSVKSHLKPTHPTPYTLHPTPYTLHPTPYTLHPTLYTLRPTPYTLHPTPYTVHPTPYTLHPTPYTLTLNPTP